MGYLSYLSHFSYWSYLSYLSYLSPISLTYLTFLTDLTFLTCLTYLTCLTNLTFLTCLTCLTYLTYFTCLTYLTCLIYLTCLFQKLMKSPNCPKFLKLLSLRRPLLRFRKGKDPKFRKRFSFSICASTSCLIPISFVSCVIFTFLKTILIVLWRSYMSYGICTCCSYMSFVIHTCLTYIIVRSEIPKKVFLYLCF
jgi:hypothetical protein